MSFDIINGFVPRSFDEILATLTEAVNAQYGTNYSPTTIQGTNIYKYFYAGIQVIMEAEQSVTDLSGRMQEYIIQTNQKILKPRGTADGFIDFIKNDGVLNTEGSFEPIIEDEAAGTVKFSMLIEPTDPDYATKLAKLFEYFHKYMSVGLYYFSGVGRGFKGDWDATVDYVVGDIVAVVDRFFIAQADNINMNPVDGGAEWNEVSSPVGFVRGVHKAINGQPFNYGFYLPRYYKMKALTITLPVSKNNNNYIMSQGEVQSVFTRNFIDYMVLGRNLEPEAIASIRDFPFANRVVYSGVYEDDTGAEVGFTNAPISIPFDVKFEPLDPNAIIVVYQ